jgi:hypothetical protein
VPYIFGTADHIEKRCHSVEVNNVSESVQDSYSVNFKGMVVKHAEQRNNYYSARKCTVSENICMDMKE